MSRYAKPMSQVLAEMKMNDPKLNILGLGRYSITHWYTYIPNLPRSDNA